MCLNHPQTITPATGYGKNVFCETNPGAKKAGDHEGRANTVPPFTSLWISRSSWKTRTQNSYTFKSCFTMSTLTSICLRESLYFCSEPDCCYLSSIPGSGRSAGEGIGYPLRYSWASLVAQLGKNLPAMQETWILSLGWEDPLEKGKATHSSILSWRTPWTAQSMGVANSQTWLSNFHFHFLFPMGKNQWLADCLRASPGMECVRPQKGRWGMLGSYCLQEQRWAIDRWEPVNKRPGSSHIIGDNSKTYSLHLPRSSIKIDSVFTEPISSSTHLLLAFPHGCLTSPFPLLCVLWPTE